MRTTADSYLSQVNTGNTVRHGFRRTMQILSLLVIVTVFWGLKLTGITMAGEAFCGMEEHVHDDVSMVRELLCELEEDPGHIHTEECMVATLHCTLGHTHGEDCYGDVLICEEAHDHETGCYERGLVCTLPEESVHTHEEGCFEAELICTEEECPGHTHSDGCFADGRVCSEIGRAHV